MPTTKQWIERAVDAFDGYRYSTSEKRMWFDQWLAGQDDAPDDLEAFEALLRDCKDGFVEAIAILEQDDADMQETYAELRRSYHYI